MTKPVVNKARPTPWSDDDLEKLVNLRATGLPWTEVARHFPGRTPGQCCGRYGYIFRADEHNAKRRLANARNGNRRTGRPTGAVECSLSPKLDDATIAAQSRRLAAYDARDLTAWICNDPPNYAELDRRERVEV